MLKRVLLLAVLAILLLPGTALPHFGDALRTETVKVGGFYTVTVRFYTPAKSGQQLEAVIQWLAPDDSGLVNARLVPAPGVNATPLATKLLPDPDSGRNALALFVTPTTGGAWDLLLTFPGQQEARIPVPVAAPAAIPVWLGWLVGLSPAYALAWFLWREGARIRREEAS